MNEVIAHVKRTCPHWKNPARQALKNNRFDLYDWEPQPRLIPITDLLKTNCRPCSQRDVQKYQKLIKQGSLPPAIVVNLNESILDGAHRLQGLINEGYTEVLAFVGTPKR